ncbi:phage portal protein [Paenibacillus durus]|uniref:Phage portal protein n=1 Tax=Paenibacillus durus ATCC 35681 TaxID=1333534 RepID=A0A0F7FAG9_PAEDU|nr:phage portal protein [Paenibacillus durus]AKG35252.1 phage portal protein [Paenibacillus durus ATCC 35681]
MYDNKDKWFVEEVNRVSNQQRINEILDIKEYLSGKHEILQKPSYNYNGQVYEPRKIVLQYAKTILNFSVGYVMSNPVTLTGDKAVTDAFKCVYKRGKYNQIDYDVLDKMTKYGYVAEYVYLDDKQEIKSKLLDPADCFPVFDHHNEYTALIEHYCVDNVSYYNLYLPDRVEEWNDKGGNLRMTGSSNNPAGLPILYHNQCEIGNLGRSDLLDILPILDNMEDLLSKAVDGYYHHISGIPVLKGQQLKGDGLPKDIIGGGIVLDDNADFFFANNEFDHQAFETLYKTLTSSLLDIAHVPAISMSKTDVSNLSEVSIRLLFSLADTKGALNSKFLREGMEQRFEKIRELLRGKGLAFSDDEYDTLGIVFQFARPSNDKEIVDNLKVLKEIDGMSLESIVERNPYVTDVQGELTRIQSENR